MPTWNPTTQSYVNGPAPTDSAGNISDRTLAADRVEANRTVRGEELDPLIPGPGEVVVGGDNGIEVAAFRTLSTMLQSLRKVASSYYFSDDFERPNTTGSVNTTNTGLGNGWQITGSGYLSARINDGAYVTSGNVYAWKLLAWTPYRMSALVSFNGSSRSVVLISSIDSNLFHNAVHILFLPTQVSLQVRQANVNTTLANITISVPTDSSVHELAFEIEGTTVIGYVDGVEVGRATNANIPTLIGPYVTYQQGGSASEATTPRIEFVEAVKKIS